MKPMRVKVHDGAGAKYLGEGNYVGDVSVYFIRMPDGSLRSCTDAEKKPLRHEIPAGGQMIASEGNPKIILDSGEVVYGCQCWWEPCRPVTDSEIGSIIGTGDTKIE